MVVKVEDLKAGEIYYFKYVGCPNSIVKIEKDGNCYGVGISENKIYHNGNAFTAHNSIETATETQKQWLEECIKKQKFIPLEKLNFNKIHELWN